MEDARWSVHWREISASAVPVHARREQLTAYWIDILLELPIGWVSVYVLLKRGDNKGQPTETWSALSLPTGHHLVANVSQDHPSLGMPDRLWRLHLATPERACQFGMCRIILERWMHGRDPCTGADLVFCVRSH